MCKAEGGLNSGPPIRVDCAKCGCPSSQAPHVQGKDGRCTQCRQKLVG